jgi:hypothetical protein
MARPPEENDSHCATLDPCTRISFQGFVGAKLMTKREAQSSVRSSNTALRPHSKPVFPLHGYYRFLLSARPPTVHLTSAI